MSTGAEKIRNAHLAHRDPSLRAHSTRQRTLILTFPTPEAAATFDAMTDQELADLLGFNAQQADL